MSIIKREVTSPELTRKSAKIAAMLSKPVKGKFGSKLSILVLRYAIGKLYRSIPKADGVKFSKVMLAGTKAILAESNGGSTSRDIIVYIHGGAFISGSAAATKGYASALARRSGCRTYSIEYTLSPEVLFPVAFDECLNAIDALAGDDPDSNITLIGDSAGGNFSLALAMKRKDKISCVILHSPVIDFSDTIDRLKYAPDSPVAKNGLKNFFTKLYIGGHDAADPRISPFWGDYEDLPPVFITCDKDEVLYADALYVYEKCKEYGIKAEMVVMDGAFHAFATVGEATPETAKLLDDYIAFMKDVNISHKIKQ